MTRVGEAALGAIVVVAAGATVTMTKTRGAAAVDAGERDEAEALLQETRGQLGAMALVLALPGPASRGLAVGRAGYQTH